MFLVSKSARKAIGTMFLVATLSTFVFAYLHIKGMAMSEMTMPGCPFMDTDTSTLCTMSPFEHIEAWQHLLTVTPTTSAILLLLFVLLLGKKRFEIFIKLARQVPFFARQFFKRNFSVTVFLNTHTFQNDFHQQLFSQGILNPKLH